MPSNPYRLPTALRPTAYRLRFEPDFASESFVGAVSIAAQVSESTDEIVLNSRDLTITATGVEQNGELIACEPTVDQEAEQLRLRLDRTIDGPEVTVNIEFEGPFNDQLVGPYISRFTDDDGVEHKLVTTQFEATHARQCFPCWDEPDLKATFQIDLVIDDDHDAVSNSNETGRSPAEGGKTVVSFAPTVTMSTYLVAFAIGPLEFTEPVDVDGIDLRVVSVPGKGHLTSFALDVGAFALRYFQDYFDLPYPGTKLDLVAIPDFAFGAMENLGCVTFRETLLLIDPARATQPELQNATDVIAHEIAHMWFGDLVTMSWWNGLWLNEAFATFMEMQCTDAFRPDWNRWTNFGLSRTAAFTTDSLATTRPIEYEVVSPVDAEGMFDVLTYEKGAAVVRMLEQYLGPDAFRSGIRRYMRDHQFGNADTPDLWDALETETGEPVREIMESWIYQGGYPQIVAQRDENGDLTVSQRRMRFAGGGATEEQRWSVPLRYRRLNDDDQSPVERVLLGPEPVNLPNTAGAPVVVNATGSGFVRVAYQPEELDELANVAIDRLTPVERYALVDDAWAAVQADQMSAPAFLNLLEAMTGEADRSVWRRIIAGFERLHRLVGGEARERLEEIVHDALAPALAGLGLTPADDDSDERRQLRADLVRALGVIANDPEIQEESKRASAAGLRDPELIDSSLLAAAIDVVAAHGDDADFDDFITAWKGATTPQEELRYLGALTDFRDQHLIERVLAMMLDGSIRTQNSPFLLRRALLNQDQGRLVWQFVVRNWDQLVEMFASSHIVRLAEGIVALDTEPDQHMVSEFFATHRVPSGQQTLDQLLEQQRVAVALRRREADRLSRFLLS